MRLVSFGNPSLHYDFPAWQSKFATNFANARNAYSTIPFMSGGFDELLGSAGFSDVGQIQCEFPLYALLRKDMEAKRDSLKEMRGWGLQRLIAAPIDPLASARFTYARISDIKIDEDLEKNSDLIQRVSVTFQAPDPTWYIVDPDVGVWGSFNWADAFWGSSIAPFAASGTLTTHNVVYAGTAIAKPKITLQCGIGQSVTNPIIRRKFNGIIQDQITWTGTLGVGDFFTVDTQAYSVTKNGVGEYNNFNYSHPDWFRLQKGTNVIEVILGGSDACSVNVTYLESYY